MLKVDHHAHGNNLEIRNRPVTWAAACNCFLNPFYIIFSWRSMLKVDHHTHGNNLEIRNRPVTWAAACNCFVDVLH
jgi:squalene cyclase